MGNADSKVAFKEKLDQFINGSVAIDDNSYWNSLLRASLEMQSIEESLTIDEIRTLRRQQNPNLEHFFARVLNELNSIIDLGTYGQTALTKEAQQTALTCVRLLTRVIPVLFEVPPSQPDDTQRLSRTESSDNHQHESRDDESVEGEQQQQQQQQQIQSEGEFVYKLFWMSPFRFNSSPGSFTPTAVDDPPSDKSEAPILAVQILTALQRLLFLKGFTVSAPGVVITRDEIPPKHKVDTRFLWKGGVGAIQDVTAPSTPAMLKARTEVLRCLLSCLSSTLYTSVEDYQSGSPPLWLWVFTRGYLPFTANLYCSLMSTVFSYDPNASYGFGLFSSGVEEEELVTISAQVLCILVDFNFSLQQQSSPQQSTTQQDNQQLMNGQQSSTTGVAPLVVHQRPNSHSQSQMTVDPRRPAAEEPESAKRSTTTTTTSSSVRNAYRLMLAGMKRDSEIDLVFNGVIRLLSTISKSKSSYIGGGKMFGGYQELLILFWHLLTINNHFTRRIASRVNANQVLQPLLVLLLENSTSRRMEVAALQAAKATPGSATKIETPKTTDTDPQQPSSPSVQSPTTSASPLSVPSAIDQERVGLLHLCSFILLVLSSEREFAVGLNAEYKDKFPLPLPAFRGCYADLLVIVTHRVVLDSLGAVANDSLIDMLLTVLCNISAYVKTFCLESCVKLLNLLNRFSKPSWLFKASYHYHNVFFLLDVLNNAVQYQYEGNLCLVYSILRQKDLFIDLQNLTFPKASLQQSSTTTPTNGTTSDTIQNDQVSPSVESEEFTTTTGGAIDASTSSSTSTAAAWTPTEKWFTDWKSRMPLHTLLRLISCLLPMVEAECHERGLINQSEVLEYLKRTTMVGLLPVPHAIIIRNYHPNAYTGLWFTTYTWSAIVSRTQHLHLFDPNAIRFLSVATANANNQG